MVGLLIVEGLLAVPSDDPERAPEGTLAFRRFLSEMGLEVERSAEFPMPGQGTFVLLDDFREEPEAKKLLKWVASGGRLVVATPDSAVSAELKLGDPSPISILGGIREVRPGCDLVVPQVDRVAISTGDSSITESPAGSTRCFPVGEGEFLVSVPHGQGEVIVLGGKSPFTNRLLRRSDNARFAYRLFAGFGPVVLGPGTDQSGLAVPASPWAALPGPAKAVVIQIGLALAVFAAARGRRFGKPVLNEPLSPLPSSGLASAIAELYRSSGAAQHAGQILTQASARRIARRVGVPVGANRSDAVQVAEQALAERGITTTAFNARVAENDQELIAMAQELAQLEESVMSR